MPENDAADGEESDEQEYDRFAPQKFRRAVESDRSDSWNPHPGMVATCPCGSLLDAGESCGSGHTAPEA